MRGTAACKPDGSYAFNVNGRIGADAAQGLNVHISPQVAQVLKRMSGTAPYELHVRGVEERAAAHRGDVPT